jgi:choline dehydrogenase
LRRVAEGLRLAARIVDRAGICIEPELLAPWAERSDEDLREYVANEHQAFYHGVGTCRMGETDQEGCVVDPDCRVRGTEGLRVVDASIVPTVPRSNTNILVMATAERAAERIRSR